MDRYSEELKQLFRDWTGLANGMDSTRYVSKGKGKAVPLQAYTGPEDS